MHDLISQYRTDLEVQLSRDLSAYEARILAEEIEQHLRERVSALVELGTSLDAAQVEALAVMGPTTALSREFRKKSPSRLTLGDSAGNWLAFSICASIVVFRNAFLSVDFLNLVMVLIWFGSPAFCRKYPWKGLLAGALMIELFLIVLPGRGHFPADLIGMSTVFLFTVISYASGILIRSLSRRVRKRLARLE